MSLRDHSVTNLVTLGVNRTAVRSLTCVDAGRSVCSRWGSNPHWDGFKPPASTDWATGARQA